MAFRNPNDAPVADSTNFYKCNHCEHLHVMLLDENDYIIARCVIDRDMLEGMLRCIDGELPPEERAN